MLKKIILVIGMFVLLTACVDKEEISKRGKEEAISYMKKNSNIDFVPQSVEFSDALGNSGLWVEGYNKKNKSQIFRVSVLYAEDDNGQMDYKVVGYGTNE
ncbi:hypothetical protein JOC77_004150 [Peribacillus deserti]|uniref:Uncharacterized protein n=2 Tax=Peribacillus deserti TaxID=673318 RepID=A0ABS2QQF1_9BACI|nr:hypothetical protein [Peribacillus deserti]